MEKIMRKYIELYTYTIKLSVLYVKLCLIPVYK